MRATPERSSVAIVAVGNELLFGETTDTNSAWLGRTFTAWGLRVVRRQTVADDAAEIREAVGDALARAGTAVVTGGLGPTEDDVTKAAVAELLGVGLVVDDGVRAAVEARFRAAGREGTPAHAEGQARVLEGATVLENVVGTAPGILWEDGERTVVLLPGVPSEMESIVGGPLRAAWTSRGRLGPPVRHRVIHTTGIAEADLAGPVERAWRALGAARDGVSLAYLPDEVGVDLRLSASGASEADASERLDRVEAALAAAVGPWRFEAPSGDLAEAVTTALRRRGLTMATAESCTGGLVAQRMTHRAGASDVFVGGVVAYANEVKVARLGVPWEVLRADGAVSERTALAMASGAAELLDAHVAVSVTGIAGPGGGSDEKPVGTVWLGVAHEGSARAIRMRFGGDRGAVRRRSAQAALWEVLGTIEGRPGGA